VNYSDHVSYPNAAKAIAETLMKASWEDAAGAVSDDLEAAFGGNAIARYVARTEAVPAWGVWSIGNWIWAMVEGCSFLSHGIGTATGYTGTPLSSPIRPYNEYFFTIAQSVANEIRTRPGYATANIRFVGHSLGGAVAEATAFRLKDEIESANCQVCTFGAPKFGNETDCRMLGRFKHARWFNEDDPVPLVFPTGADNPGILFVLTIPQLVRIGEFTHPAGGLEITQSGTIRAAALPGIATLDAVSNIGAWLLSIDRGQSTPHDLDAYVQRLGFWLARATPPSGRPTPSTIVPPTEDTSRVNLTRAQTEVVRRLRVNEAAQRRHEVRIPRTHLVTVERVGKLWQVRWGEQTMAVRTRRASAAKIKNLANGFLEGLLQSGLVDVHTVREKMTSFLDAATTAGSGIEPRMQEEV